MKKVFLIDSYSNVIKNRFELCVVASERAKAILFSNNSFGVSQKKEVRLALEEMKDGKIDVEAVKLNIAKNAMRSLREESGFIDVSKSITDQQGNALVDIEMDFGMFSDQNIDS